MTYLLAVLQIIAHTSSQDSTWIVSVQRRKAQLRFDGRSAMLVSHFPLSVSSHMH
jgi:hypothetical protein